MLRRSLEVYLLAASARRGRPAQAGDDAAVAALSEHLATQRALLSDIEVLPGMDGARAQLRAEIMAVEYALTAYDSGAGSCSRQPVAFGHI